MFDYPHEPVVVAILANSLSVYASLLVKNEFSLGYFVEATLIERYSKCLVCIYFVGCKKTPRGQLKHYPMKGTYFQHSYHS